MRLSLLQRKENAHDDSVWAAAWAPGSNTLATGSVDESVKLWSEVGDTLEQKHHLLGLSLGVVGVAVDSSGEHGAATSLDSMVTVWSMASQQAVARFEQPPSEAWSLAFVPGGDAPLLAVAGGSSHSVRLLDVAAQAETRALAMPAAEEGRPAGKEHFVLSVAASPDGRRIAAGSMSGAVAVWDAASGQLLHSLPGHFKPVRGLAFTPDSRHVLTACDDMHSHMYDVEHGALVEAFSGHESWVLSVAPHPGGAAFATGGSDSKVKLWDLATRTCAQTLGDHGDQVWAVAFRADGGRLASASDDKSVCLYDCA